MELELLSQETLYTLQNYLQNKNEAMGYDQNGNFNILKKCLILFNKDDERFSYDPLEIFIPVREYFILKNYVEKTGSHYIKKFKVHVFFGVKDFWNTMIDAQNHKLF